MLKVINKAVSEVLTLSRRLMLMICTNVWIQRLEREMKDWDLGIRSDLLPENEDKGPDIEAEEFSDTNNRQIRWNHLGSGCKLGR